MKKKYSLGVTTLFTRWNSIFEQSMTGTSSTEWSLLFQNIFKRNSNNKANEIKYKAIHFALPTNSVFKRRGHAQDDFCPQCMKDRETLSHMIYSCEKVQPLIKYTIFLLNKIYPSSKPFKNTFKFYLFGFVENAQKFYIGNLLLDELLYYVYSMRMKAYHERSISARISLLKAFIAKIKKILQTEHDIAKENNQLNFFLNETKEIRDINGNIKLEDKLNQFLS